MKNMMQMMKQAQQMKKNMKKMQDELVNIEMEGQAGGGMVTVLMNGKSTVRRVHINPDVADDMETLEDLLVAAFNDAHTKVQTYVDGEVNKLTGGMDLGM